MSDDYDDEVYGDTDSNNLPDNAPGRAASVGDGLPGYPVEGHPGWRAGAFGAGRGVLGLIKVSNPTSRGSDSLPPAYESDGHGGVRLRPDFAATHPKGPLDFEGMTKEINWPGVALDLGKIGAGVAATVGPTLVVPFVRSLVGLGAAPAAAVGAAGTGATPNPVVTGGALAWRGDRTLRNQNKVNPRNADPALKPDVDRASNGLP